MEAERNSKGQFVKGPGRKPGSQNKVKADIQNKIRDLVNDNYDTIKKDLEKMKPAQRVKFFIDLLKYVIPAKKETDLTVDLERLPDDQINEIVEQILNHE